MELLKLNSRFLLFLRNSEISLLRRISNSACSKSCEANNSYPISENTTDSQSDLHKRIPINVEEYKELRKLKPCQPTNPHLLKVSILGEPNVGKSTLTNALVKWKVCAVSSKVHTTRKKAAAILVEENKQIVFLDTPGFVSPEVTKKHLLEPSFVMDPVKSIRDSDLIAVVVDVANRWTNNRINENVLEMLDTFKEKKSILVLNKVDAMKSRNRILSFIKILTAGIVAGVPTLEFEKTSNKKELSMAEILYETNKTPVIASDCDQDVQTSDEMHKRGWPLFSRVFMVSALKNDGVDALREYLLSETLPHDWMYHDSTVTDQHPHDIAILIVREKLLEYLPQEIPYQVNLQVSKWEMLSSGCPKINIKILCSNSRHKRFIIGPNGQHIAACADRSRKAMREAFRRDVVLHLGVN